MDDPAIKGIVINSHDVTDTIEYLQAIEHQNKVLQQISWSQSHEVRAPLSAILGIVDLITSDPGTPKLQELLTLLKAASLKLDTIVKETVKRAEILERKT